MGEFSADGLTALLSYDTFGFPIELLIAVGLLMRREPRRPAFAARAICMTAIVLSVALCAAAALGHGWLNLLRYALVFASMAGALRLCFDVNAREALFFGLAAYNVQHASWQRAGLALSIMGQRGVNEFTPTLIAIPAMVVLSLCFLRGLRDHRDATVNNRQLIALVSVVIIVDLVLNYIPFLTEGSAMRSPTEQAYALICCLLTLVIQSDILTRSRLEREQALFQELWELNRSQYELAKQSVDVINARSHDLKKQLGVLLAATERRDQGESEAIREIRRSIETYDNTAKTGCPALDVLLTQKLMQARAQQTSLAYLIDGDEFRFLDEVDLYALFGNVLDNALEAVARIEDPASRVISLRAVRRGRLLSIHCENYLDSEVTLEKDGLPRTTKAEASEHGFGLRSVRMVVDKYGGHLAVHAEDGVFHVQVVIPQPGSATGSTRH